MKAFFAKSDRVLSGYLIYVRQLNVDDCSCESEKCLSRNKFSLLQWRFYVIFISPSRITQTNQSRWTETPRKFSLSVTCQGLRGTWTFFNRNNVFLVHSPQLLEKNLKREKINVGAVGIIGTFTRIIKREKNHFLRFSCLFILLLFSLLLFLLFWAIFFVFYIYLCHF